RPGEDEETRLLRPELLRLVAGEGEDPALAADARRLAERWLADHRADEPDLVETVLSVAARRGDRALFDRFHAAARQATDPREREQLLNVLGSFQDPVL